MIQNLLFEVAGKLFVSRNRRTVEFSAVGLIVLSLFLIPLTRVGVVNAETTDEADATSETAPFIVGSRSDLDTKMILPANIVAQQACDVFTIGDAGRPRIDMIDIASYQSGLTQANFDKMKALGVKTVVVKLTESTTYTNPAARAQINMARAAGLEVRVYHYAQFTTAAEARSEASHFAQVAKSYGLSSSMMFYADMEEPKTANSSVAGNLTAFYSTLAANGYNNYGVYTFLSYGSRAAVVNILGQKKAWLAQYPYQPSASKLLNTSYAAWQFSSTARLPGYGSNLDVSIDYYDDNQGNLESAKINNKTLHVSGWHATNSSTARPISYLILFDKTHDKELQRVKINRTQCVDVNGAHPYITNSLQSGFSGDFQLGSQMISGAQLQIISRYTNDANGNGDAVDYRSSAFTFNQNIGHLESAYINGNQLHVSGWHVSDGSAGRNNSFIILYDFNSRKELARYQIGRNNRTDVKSIYPNVYNSTQSGFALNIPINFDLANKKIQVISRYSSSTTGNSSYSDYWSSAKTFNSNIGHIDALKKEGNQLYISGWHIADTSTTRKNSYIILYDQKNHKELARFKINRIQRADVNKIYPNVYNSVQSGFSLKVPYEASYKDKNIQVISRYSTQANGEGSYVDYWSTGKVVN